ncbi:MAG: hypothetical protein CVU50_08185 [Candidatus Cloacimonetes bacterium HGW-Cloacimonetes-3]|jgi:hypothetical protein|nr:MAG: hypothetical protein CVU50_08185 [Candidatus Cloacimonetes bacterium HGW-Cloacimonetes-3]
MSKTDRILTNLSQIVVPTKAYFKPAEVAWAAWYNSQKQYVKHLKACLWVSTAVITYRLVTGLKRTELIGFSTACPTLQTTILHINRGNNA